MFSDSENDDSCSQKELSKKSLEESPSSCECEEPDDEEERDATPLDGEYIDTLLCSGIAQGGTTGGGWQTFSVMMKIPIPFQPSLHSFKEKGEVQTQHTFSTIGQSRKLSIVTVDRCIYGPTRSASSGSS